MSEMDDTEFDQALVASAFRLAAERGWGGVSVTQAARDADLPLDRARRRFPGRGAILAVLGRQADAAALAVAPNEGAPRDRLFDLLMRRFDALQQHRAGVLALMRHLPFDPFTAMALGAMNMLSMAWMLEAAGISAQGPRGMLRTKGLLAIWLYTLNAWRRDESEDLSATMAALDTALSRAEQAQSWLGGGHHHPDMEPGPTPETDPTLDPNPDLGPGTEPPPPPSSPPEPPASPPT
jgi:AcrR family transcriptional regulator